MYWILETKERGGRSREWRVVERWGREELKARKWKRPEEGKEEEKEEWW